MRNYKPLVTLVAAFAIVLLPSVISKAPRRHPAAALNRMTFEFSLNGEGGSHSVFNAASLMNAHVLRVRLQVLPGAAGTGDSPIASDPALSYGCARLALTVGDKRIESAPLSTGATSTSCAATEQRLDLSADLDNLRRANKYRKGAVPLPLTLAEAETDSFCRAIQAGRMLGNSADYCPTYPAQSGQSVRGMIEIETDAALTN